VAPGGEMPHVDERKQGKHVVIAVFSGETGGDEVTGGRS